MTYIIAEPCIGTKDTACVDVCPVDCIHPRKDEATFADDTMLYIDPEVCLRDSNRRQRLQKGRNAPFLFFKNSADHSRPFSYAPTSDPATGSGRMGVPPVDQLLKLPLSLQREPEGLVGSVE